MVLQKRKADGSFEDWHSKTSMPTSTSNKRARTTISDASSYPATHSHCLAPPAPALAGPSSQSLASTSHYSTAASSSSKKTAEKATKGKGKAKEKPVKEKRKAQFKSKCPQATQTRLDRYISQAQRIYLIHRRRTEGENREEFTVQGSTGNVYTVTIDEVPHCDCPDHQKGNHCKHILFIFLKVLQVSRDSGLWYQKALLPSELESIFSSAPLAPQLRQQLQNIHADERVVGAWREKTGRGPAPAPEGCVSLSFVFFQLNTNAILKPIPARPPRIRPPPRKTRAASQIRKTIVRFVMTR
ncbi:hypothetical protein VKT23_013470 [Stygiomarasmius scandens]|uniref:SWIM-type domain-containing protein n=1 Tax=Marasmiellus scandens TaxID=2682957 RepID=A0ABR1J651_9AGAR